MTVTTQKPSYRPRMLGNGPSLGFVAPVIPWLLRAGLYTAAGAGLYSLVTGAAKSVAPSIPINLENLGLASLLGGAGVASYLMTGVLPEGSRPIGYALAVAGIAGSIYLLAQPPKTPRAPAEGAFAPAVIPPDLQAPNLPPGPMAQALTLYTDPSWGGSVGGGVYRSIYFNQPYRLIAQNNTNAPVWVYVGVRLDYEGETEPAFRSPPIEPKFGRQLKELPPGGQTVNIDMMIPWGVPIGNAAVSFELFREREAKDPFMTSEAIPVYYYLYG